MKNKYQEKVQFHYDVLDEKGYEVMAVMLYGSQNYSLDTLSSDVDTKAIIIPSLEDLIDAKQVSKTISIDDGQCDVKDIRLMVKNYEKQNVNYIETLFTDYYVVNPNYEKEYKTLKNNREIIARLDENRAVNCIRGMIHNKFAHLTKDTPATHNDISIIGYDRKNYCHIQRLLWLMIDYIDNIFPYEKILKYSNEKREYLINLKTKIYNCNEVIKDANEIIEKADILADNFHGKKNSYTFSVKDILKKKYAAVY